MIGLIMFRRSQSQPMPFLLHLFGTGQQLWDHSLGQTGVSSALNDPKR